jgi:hypothetical protein
MSACDDWAGVCYGAQGAGRHAEPVPGSRPRTGMGQPGGAKRAGSLFHREAMASGAGTYRGSGGCGDIGMGSPNRSRSTCQAHRTEGRARAQHRWGWHHQGAQQSARRETQRCAQTRCAGGWKGRGRCQAQLSASLQNGHATGCNTVALACCESDYCFPRRYSRRCAATTYAKRAAAGDCRLDGALNWRLSACKNAALTRPRSPRPLTNRSSTSAIQWHHADASLRLPVSGSDAIVPA